MILLRLISWPYARKHLLRSILTTAGIVLGVALFVGMHTANRSVLGAFNRTVDRIAGSTELQVSAGESGFDEEILERVQAQPEVRIAVPVIEAPVETGLKGQGNLLILAVDMTGDRGLRNYDFEGDDVIDDPLVFLAQPDSLIVSREFADRNGLRLQSKLSMSTMNGPRRFTIRGLMKTGGLASAFGGNLAIMDIYAAQQVFGRGRKFDRIDLAVKEGVTVEQCRAALEKLLGPGFEVGPPGSRGSQFESIVKVFSISSAMSSAFALFIGLFIIYNSFSIAVTERRKEIGILRALGATRGRIRNLFLSEGAAAGIFGSLAGLAAGVLIAKGLSRYVSGLLVDIYSVGERSDEITIDPGLLAWAFAIGVATSVLASFLPARSAARVDPVQALQKGRLQVLSAGENRIRRWLAVTLVAICAACLTLGGSRPVFYVGFFSVIVASLLFTPSLSLWMARALRPALQWMRPIEGALAADSLIQAPRRTSATVTALMMSLAMVIAFNGLAVASYDSIVEWLDSTFNPDLFVNTNRTLGARSFHFPAVIGEQLSAIDGIQTVQGVRTLRVTFRGTPILLVSADLRGIARHTVNPRAVAGDYREMHRLAGEGKGAVVAENLAMLHKLGLGSEVEIASPGGVLRLPVVGVLRDFSDQLGTIFIDTSVYLKYWNDDTVDIFRVYLKKSASAEIVKGRIQERFAGERRLFVLMNTEIKDYVIRLTDQWFAMTHVQTAVAVLVAILGIVNTLTVSIGDRRREIGVLRAVGALNAQVRHTIWMEALAVAFIGLVLGMLLGAVNLYYQLDIVQRDISGLVVAYRFPFMASLWLVPVMLASAFLAALWPGEAAVRSSLVEALEYE